MARVNTVFEYAEDDRGVRHRLWQVDVRDETAFRITGRSFRLARSAVADPVVRSALTRRRILAYESHRGILRLMVWAAFAGLFAWIALAVREGAWGGAALLLVMPAVLCWGLWREPRRLDGDVALLSTLPPVCIACGYDLSGAVAEADGCTVCPECGAAWRLDAWQGGPRADGSGADARASRTSRQSLSASQ